MKYLVITLIALAVVSCEPFPAVLPLDWPIHHQDSVVVDTVPVDTIPVDTINTDTIVPCQEYIPVDTPQFICGYMLFDTPQDSNNVWWQGGGASSFKLEEVLEVVFPGHTYSVWKTPLAWSVIVDGVPYNTNLQLKVFCRPDGGAGAKRYVSWSDRGFTFFETLTQQQYSEVIDKYTSVKLFNFKNTNYDSLFYEDAAYRILGHCKKGGKWADFRFNPYPMPDTIITQFQDAKWEKVLH